MHRLDLFQRTALPPVPYRHGAAHQRDAVQPAAPLPAEQETREAHDDFPDPIRMR